MKRLFALTLCLLLIAATALADTTLTGTVVYSGTVTVLSPAEGTLADVAVQPGDRVTEGDTVASLQATTVYANESGTVRIYGAEGASLEEICTRYGAVLYILPDQIYTLTASTSAAYDTEANKRILSGETVYLRAKANTSRVGTGTVTGVNGSDYLVHVTSGDFLSGEILYIYRESSYAAASRIGKGSIAYTGAVGYTGTGEDVSISSSTSTSKGRTAAVTSTEETEEEDSTAPQSLLKLLVTDGQHVDPGTPLFTVSMADAYAQHMLAPATGVVTEVSTSAGSTVVPGTSIATIAPDTMMRLALHVPEDDLASVRMGSEVTIRFLSGEMAVGTVLSLQGLAETSEETEEDEDEETCFTVYVSFPATPTIAYGMTGKVTIGE